MAESRLAIQLPHGQPGWHRLTIDVSAHTTQAAVSDDGLVLYVPHPRYAYRNLLRTFFHARNKLYTALYPFSPLQAFLTVVAVSLYIAMAPSDAYIRNCAFADLLWRLDTAVVPLVDYLPVSYRVFYLSAWTSLAIILAFVFLQRLILRFLLQYKGWLFDPPGRPSLCTKLWATFTKYVYMKRGDLCTYSFQHALPRLPVPNLKDTCRRYMRTVKPILTEAEYVDLEKMKDEFIAKSGLKLQALLLARSWLTNNYISQWWLRFVYLRSRGPLYINSNYYAISSTHPKGLYSHNPIARAASLIHATCVVKQMIDRESISPVLVGGVQPLCMYQYGRMFSTTRIPHREEDTLMHWDAAESRHVVVLYDKTYYKVRCYTRRTGRLLTPFEFQVVLQNMAHFHETEKKRQPYLQNAARLAACTTLDRTKWAEIRDTYFEYGTNHASLSEIEKAILVVSFDESSPDELSEVGYRTFVGDGGNRWCDKSLQYVVFANGKATCSVEHSFADAPVPSHYMEMIQCKILQLKGFDPESGLIHPSEIDADDLAPAYPLQFVIEEPLEREIAAAFESARERADDLQLHIERTNFGKGVIKSMRMSPDAFIQMALQLAYYRLNRKFAQTYESSMTRFFRNGRTETIRSCSEQSVEFVLAMEDAARTNDERLALLRTATESHSHQARMCAIGAGVDRHLFALYVVARGTETECPFLDRALSMPWRLSTSQVPFGQATEDVPEGYLTDEKYTYPCGGFGPVTDDGYGVCYCLNGENTIFFHISAKKSCAETCPIKFKDTLLGCFRDMFALAEKGKK